MSSIVQEESTLRMREKRVMPLSRERAFELLGMTGIVLLAVWLRFSNLDSLGYANHYYTAGVKSMLQSWHNFFYVAAEPGGSVSIDKPPVGLWLQAISAYILGVNGVGVLLPQLIAGILSIIVLYHLVRRTFGMIPGLLAALILAITPIVVATDRNNTMDSNLILTLLLATWAFIKATETRKLRFLLLGATLVGIGFNIKMLQAYLPLPAFYGIYFLGSSETIGRKVGKLALASILLLTVSLSWAVAVDLTPADQRPYVGSSSDNSELNLIVGYNGVNRLLGMFGRRNGNPPNAGQAPQPGTFPPGGFNRDDSIRPPFDDNNANRGPGGFNIGTPGALRLFIPPLNKEMSWLLPFGFVSMVLLGVGSRWRWPLGETHQALVLWGGWLVTCAVFFSIAGFFHEYYLSMMGPPLAALVGIGIYQLWQSIGTRPWLAIGVLTFSLVGTIAFQVYTAKSFIQTIWWLPVALVMLLGGLAMLVFSFWNQKPGLRLAGYTLMVLAVLITPAVWSIYTNLSASQNQSLPSAYSGGALGPVAQRDLRVNQTLLQYLEANTQHNTYLMAVPSSMQGADYILATGRPVLYLGGFSGQDPVASAADLAQMVSEGKLRYIYWGQERRGPGTNSDISSWITASCSVVKGFDASIRNAGAPDGIAVNPGDGTTDSNRFFPVAGPGPEMQATLYDCGTP